MSVLMNEWPRPHRITVEHYYRMAEVGMFAPDARVELIAGAIIDMAPIGSRHAAAVARLGDLLAAAVGRRAMIRQQLPLRLGEYSEPQPDLAVVNWRDDYYAAGHPTAADVLLLIEVSDTTLRYDRDVKVGLYAQYAVPEAWIVDLTTDSIHFYREPRTGEYTVASSTTPGGPTPITALPPAAVDLSLLFP